MTNQYPGAQPPQYGAGAPAEDPGKTLGIVGLVFAILAPVVGIIISAIARSKSKAAGFDNQLAKWGLIIGIILTVVYIVAGIAMGAAWFSLMSSYGGM